MWVVKLGGSLAFSDDLPHWLDALAQVEDLVVVPGGGAFADQVRTAQWHWRFSDRAAHRMALLAMEQMAHMLCDLHPAFVATPDPQGFVAGQGVGIPVWLPADAVLSDHAIEQDWRVTSDSLACWLAARLDVDGVLLVKSAEVPDGMRPLLATLQREGILDAAFDRYAAMLDCPILLAHRNDSDMLQKIIALRSESRLPIAC